MTIGAVVKAAGVPASTIRYYEATGIIPKASRRNGVRQFAPEVIDELKALRLYRASGIPIRGLKAIGTHPRGTKERAAAWAHVLRARIADLDASMHEAQTTKDLLEKVIACHCNGKREHCKLVDAAEALPVRES